MTADDGPPYDCEAPVDKDWDDGPPYDCEAPLDEDCPLLDAEAPPMTGDDGPP